MSEKTRTGGREKEGYATSCGGTLADFRTGITLIDKESRRKLLAVCGWKRLVKEKHNE